MSTDLNHTKPIAFFLGAGASKPAGLPIMDELSRGLLEMLNSKKESGKQSLAEKHNVTEVVKLLMFHPRSQGKDYVDFEVLLDALYSCINPDTYPLFHLADKDLFCLFSEPDTLLGFIHSYILRQVSDIKSTEHLRFLDYTQENQRQVDVFTTNYDKCLEVYCESNRILYNVPNPMMLPSSLYDASSSSLQSDIINLVKLHGSVLWRVNKAKAFFPVSPLEDDDYLGAHDDLISDRLMVFPAVSKELTNDPYLTLHRYFQSSLQSIKSLIVIGYSFHDAYILDILYSHCRQNKEFPIIVIDPNGSENIRSKRELLKDRYGDDLLLEHFICFDMNCETFAKRKIFNLISQVTTIYDFRLFDQIGQYQDNYLSDPAYFARRKHLKELKRLEKMDDIYSACSIMAFLNMIKGDKLFDNSSEMNKLYAYYAICNLISSVKVRYMQDSNSSKETSILDVMRRYWVELDKLSIKMLGRRIQHSMHSNAFGVDVLNLCEAIKSKCKPNPHINKMVYSIMSIIASIIELSEKITDEIAAKGSAEVEYDQILLNWEQIKEYMQKVKNDWENVKLDNWLT